MTCASTSRPAISIVRKVAEPGRPIAGPVIASTSSIEYRPASTARRIVATPCRPRWLPMKFGVSFATTTPLPRTRSPNALIRATMAGSVSGVGTSSSSAR